MTPKRKAFLTNIGINYLILTIITFIFSLFITTWNMDLISITRLIIAGIIAYYNPLIRK